MADFDTEVAGFDGSIAKSDGKYGNRLRKVPKDVLTDFNTKPFKKEDNVAGTFTEESSFMVLFPKYREIYLKEAWPLITQALASHAIACVLDLVEGRMTVKTTRKTYDPAAILKARDLIKLLGRSVPAQQAVKILEDGCGCDIIKIRNLVGPKDQFVKRRQRILGPNGNTLKALQLLTSTYILVHGDTVSVMGPYRGLAEIRDVVEGCMHNIHPIYRVKEMMVRRNLATDPNMANVSWEPYLPKFDKKVLSSRRAPKKVTDKTKKVYTPFPPAPVKSKIDLQIESGEYFLSKMAKDRMAREDRFEKQKEKKVERAAERAKDFVCPEEPGMEEKKKKKRKMDADSEEKREKKKRRKRAEAED